jgi:hypothetical protein
LKQRRIRGGFSHLHPDILKQNKKTDFSASLCLKNFSFSFFEENKESAGGFFTPHLQFQKQNKKTNIVMRRCAVNYSAFKKVVFFRGFEDCIGHSY